MGNGYVLDFGVVCFVPFDRWQTILYSKESFNKEDLIWLIGIEKCKDFSTYQGKEVCMAILQTSAVCLMWLMCHSLSICTIRRHLIFLAYCFLLKNKPGTLFPPFWQLFKQFSSISSLLLNYFDQVSFIAHTFWICLIFFSFSFPLPLFSSIIFAFFLKI